MLHGRALCGRHTAHRNLRRICATALGAALLIAGTKIARCRFSGCHDQQPNRGTHLFETLIH